jgi:hypothetical protein
MVHDSDGGQLILYGGGINLNPDGPITYFDDVWTYGTLPDG